MRQTLCVLFVLWVVACGDDDHDHVHVDGGESGTGGVGGSGGSGGSGGFGGTGGADEPDATVGDLDASHGASLDATSPVHDAHVGDLDADLTDAGVARDASLPATPCRPGHYLGQSSGQYRSTTYGNGGDATSLPWMSMTTEGGEPGFELTLTQVARPNCTPGAEHCATHTIDEGVIRGALMASIVGVPLYATFTGTLDCNTGQARAQMTGEYTVLNSQTFMFAGRMSASFDIAADAFENGTWTVEEQPPPGMQWPPGSNIGGEGTWSATWTQQ